MRIPAGRFWAKLDRDADGAVTAWHSVIEHSADVAATFEALIALKTFRTRFAALADCEFSEATAARLAVFAALHDLGKFNHGFSNRRHLKPDFWAGHERESLALLAARDRHTDRFVQILEAAGIPDWQTNAEPGTVVEYLVTSFGHHGRPRPFSFPPEIGHPMSRLWSPSTVRIPLAGVESLVRATRDWFPAAFEPDAEPLPTSRRLQHAYAGLLTLADWMGSDPRFFRYANGERGACIAEPREQASRALRVIGLDTRAPRSSIRGTSIHFGRIWKGDPRPPQQVVTELPVPTGASLTILEAPTGSGKTEAALLRFLTLYQAGAVDGLYFALPTRAASTQMHGRVRDAVGRLFPEAVRPAVVLAVPGYIRIDDQDADRLPGPEVLWPDDRSGSGRGWAAEHPKRFLAGSVVVGTIDQVLLSSLRARHAHLRAASLLRHLVVVDEVHSSDVYMEELLAATIDRQLQAGGHVFLMSATLGSSVRDRYLALNGRPNGHMGLDQASSVPYPVVWHTERGQPSVEIAAPASGSPKHVRVTAAPAAGDPDSVARTAAEAASQGARVLVIRNTVGDARQTQAALERHTGAHARADLLFRCEGVVAPHHSRFAATDRTRLDKAVEAVFGKRTGRRGIVLVATQTVEQSLDIDADLLVTDLCPMDVLLQRIGRLHRHPRGDRPASYALPQVLVLVPEEREMGLWIRERAKGGIQRGQAIGKHGLGTVYTDLRILEATWREIERGAAWSLPSQNRSLVERATHPDVLAALTQELGGAWRVHGEYVGGIRSAHGQHARINRVDWTLPWTDPRCLFPDAGEESVQSRLGERDRLIVLDPPVNGPFGQAVSEIALPHHWDRGLGDDPPVTVLESSTKHVLDFDYGRLALRYDRTGLHQRNPVG